MSPRPPPGITGDVKARATPPPPLSPGHTDTRKPGDSRAPAGKADMWNFGSAQAAQLILALVGEATHGPGPHTRSQIHRERLRCCCRCYRLGGTIPSEFDITSPAVRRSRVRVVASIKIALQSSRFCVYSFAFSFHWNGRPQRGDGQIGILLGYGCTPFGMAHQGVAPRGCKGPTQANHFGNFVNLSSDKARAR